MQQRSLLTDEQREGAIDTFFVTVKEELDITPAKVQVIEHLQEKAVYLDDEGKRCLREAKQPAHPLGKSVASVALLAYLIIAKYMVGLSLYRLEGILKRYGGSINRSTMAGWLIRQSMQLQCVVNLLQEMQLTADYLQGDETRQQVLKEPGKDPTSDKWVWVIRGGPPDKPVVFSITTNLEAVPLRGSCSKVLVGAITNAMAMRVRKWRQAINTLLLSVVWTCLLYTSPSPRDQRGSRMPSSA